jgi:hypothetical protein
MDNQTKEKIKGILTTLRDSCREGEDLGIVLYMSEGCEVIAKLLDINLKPYYNDNEND